MTILLALTSAVAYGLSDFVGAITARRTSAWPVALTSAVGALLGAGVLTAVKAGHPVAADWWWAALAGLAGGVGIAFLYRGFAAGQMAVAGPVSAVGTALLPVAVGLATGERLGPLPLIGIVIAVPGLWLVARVTGEDGGGRLAEGLVDGVVAGLGFGGAFVSMGQWTSGAGYSPFVVMQLVSIVATIALATAFREPWRPDRTALAGGGVAGMIAAGALVAFVVAVAGTDLAIASVLASLYPAVTVMLALAILRERISLPQAVGLLLCAGTVGLVAAG